MKTVLLLGAAGRDFHNFNVFFRRNLDYSAEQMAQYARIPVINGHTDYSHPWQAMADYPTMWESKGNLEGLKVAFRRRWQQRRPLTHVCRRPIGCPRVGGDSARLRTQGRRRQMVVSACPRDRRELHDHE